VTATDGPRADAGPLVELAGVEKHYGALRPLRVERLAVRARELTAVAGPDAAAAETLVNLITGATLPDRGRISIFGRDTAAIADSTQWLSLIDRFGIVSARVVLLDGLTVAQNLAIPFSLDIDPLGAELRARAIALGRDAGLGDADADRRVAELDPLSRLRLRVARAVALEPALVLLEHPTAELAAADAARAGGEIRALLMRTGAAGLAFTADREFARAFAPRPLILNAARGTLEEEGRGWFRRSRT
jgi:ABC-type lipoprotein export system ATPase subunit